MGVSVTCPRCGGAVRPPDLMHTEWRCHADGPVLPFHVAEHINEAIVESVCARVQAHPDRTVPMWCPWPLPHGWTVTGVGWVGDERSGVRGTAIACSGPCPVEGGPAEVILIAEDPGVGLGTRFAGIPGPDPGPFLGEDLSDTQAHARVRVAGRPTALWMVKCPDDRSAYVGEARGLWLYAVSWPAAAAYLLADDVALHDLVESVPRQLVYGAPSPYLHGWA